MKGGISRSYFPIMDLLKWSIYECKGEDSPHLLREVFPRTEEWLLTSPLADRRRPPMFPPKEREPHSPTYQYDGTPPSTLDLEITYRYGTKVPTSTLCHYEKWCVTYKAPVWGCQTLSAFQVSAPVIAGLYLLALANQLAAALFGLALIILSWYRFLKTSSFNLV